MPNFDSPAFRRALGIFATGVTIVTTRDAAGNPVGLTANSFNSVSLDPPLVLWSLSKSSNCLSAFGSAKHFAVHLLAASQQPLSERFAKRGVDKFAQLPIERGIGEVPLLMGCAARFQCRMFLQHDAGDHVILVGEVLQFDKSDLPPLVFYSGSYAVAARGPQAVPWQAVYSHRAGGFSEDSLHYLVGLLGMQLNHHITSAILALGFEDLCEFQLLLILGLREGLSLAGANALVPSADPYFTGAMCERLCSAGLASSDGDGRLWLTDKGRERIVAGTAIAKIKEEDAFGNLDEAERAALRHLLKRVIVHTNVEAPQSNASSPSRPATQGS